MSWEADVARSLGARVLGSVATVADGRSAIMESGAVNVLASTLMDAASDVSRLSCADALFAVSNGRDGAPILCASDAAVKSMVACLKSGDGGNDMQQGTACSLVSACANLALHEAGARTLMNSNAVDALSSLLAGGRRVWRDEVLAAACRCVWNLSMEESGRER